LLLFSPIRLCLRGSNLILCPVGCPALGPGARGPSGALGDDERQRCSQNLREFTEILRAPQAQKSQSLKVLKSQSLQVSKSQSLKVSNSESLKVSKSESLKVSKSQSLKVSKSQSLKFSKSQSVKV
jgi:hypothetical protein